MQNLIRPSQPADLDAITRIYAHHVARGTSSFELESPSSPEMARRRDEVVQRGLPWLVADAGAGVVGYAYASPFRLRPAYRFTVEDSIYIDPSHQRRGLGRALLAELIAACAATGARQMLAVIGDALDASVQVHRALGFEPCGTLQAVGWKFDRWRDVALMQRALGAGSASTPAAP